MQVVSLADGREARYELAQERPGGRLYVWGPGDRTGWFAPGYWTGYADDRLVIAMARFQKDGFTMERASETEAKPLLWLWDDRLLMGFINVILGMEKVGKGNFVAWLVAQVTRGALDGTLKGKPRNVLLFGHEDSWERVWIPRLRLSKANMRRVMMVHEIDGEPFNVHRHGERLVQVVRKNQVGFVYFDQFLDTLGIGVSENRVKPVRDAVNPLAKAAQRTQCAFLGTLHPNKRVTGTFRDAISGTPAWNQLSRSGLYLTKHPADPERRCVVVAAANYSKGAQSFEFEIVDGTFRNAQNELIVSSYVNPKSIKYGHVTDADVLGARVGGGGGGGPVLSKAAKGRDYIRTRLNGDRVPSAELKKELKDLFEIDMRSAVRIARDMGVTMEADGYPRVTYWRM
jgi:hypothetical protein